MAIQFTCSLGGLELILLFVAVVRIMGTDRGYKALFVVIAILIVLKTIRGW